MNTLGLGSGRDYNARNRLDAATLDRWNAGRVQITLDPRIEESHVLDHHQPGGVRQNGNRKDSGTSRR